MTKKNTHNSNHIVYCAKLGGKYLYVGSGHPDRYKHINSGVSHVYELNKFHFEGKVIEVEILHEGLSKEESTRLEEETIFELKPEYNYQAKMYNHFHLEATYRRILALVDIDYEDVPPNKIYLLNFIKYVVPKLKWGYRMVLNTKDLKDYCPPLHELFIKRVMSPSSIKGGYPKLRAIFSFNKVDKYNVEVILNEGYRV